MPDPSEPTSQQLIPRAAAAFGRTVHQVPADAWGNGTPCTDWTVRDVVNHLTGEHLWVPPLLAGKTLDDVGDAFSGDVLGDDPVAAWDDAIDASVAAWGDVDPGLAVHLSVGPTPAPTVRRKGAACGAMWRLKTPPWAALIAVIPAPSSSATQTRSPPKTSAAGLPPTLIRCSIYPLSPSILNTDS